MNNYNNPNHNNNVNSGKCDQDNYNNRSASFRSSLSRDNGTSQERDQPQVGDMDSMSLTALLSRATPRRELQTVTPNESSENRMEYIRNIVDRAVNPRLFDRILRVDQQNEFNFNEQEQERWQQQRDDPDDRQRPPEQQVTNEDTAKFLKINVVLRDEVNKCYGNR
jgi:hypothetical protein